MDTDDPDYDNNYAAQLAALDQVRAVQFRLLPIDQREQLATTVRSFIGLRLDEAIDRVVQAGYDTWYDEMMDRVQNGAWNIDVIAGHLRRRA